MDVNGAVQAVTTASACLPSDEEIVARVQSGDTALYEVLMRRYNQRLFRISRSILRDDDEAEDVTQDTWVRAYASLHQFAGKAKFSTWLSKIAINEASTRLRKQKRFQHFPADSTREGANTDCVKWSDPDPEQQVLGREAISLLEEAVDTLPDIYRCVFVLREIENMSTSETATCLELSEENVKVRLTRARQMLRSELYVRAGATSSRAFAFMGERCNRVVHNVLDRLRLESPFPA
jgi:RNA polymerase sigma-70 factor (ECF subfamily)